MAVYRPPMASEVFALKQKALELCWEIEKLPASPEQTALVSRASAIHSALQDLLFDNGELRTETDPAGGAGRSTQKRDALVAAFLRDYQLETTTRRGR